MENATKALLIAAAVLIAIVLIALGVNLIKAGGNTSGKAGEVGTALKEQTENTSQTAVGKIEGLFGDGTSGEISLTKVNTLKEILGLSTVTKGTGTEAPKSNITDTTPVRFVLNDSNMISIKDDENKAKTLGALSQMSLEDIEDATGINFASDYETFTGLVFNTLGMIPDDGEQNIELEIGRAKINVTQVLEHQIHAATILVTPEEAKEGEDGDE